MGRRGPPKKAVTAGPLTKPLPAQGKGPNKRTPSSAFDPAAGKETYEAEDVVAMGEFWQSVCCVLVHAIATAHDRGGRSVVARVVQQ